MIQTVNLVEAVEGRNAPNTIYNHRQGLSVDNLSTVSNVPEGYISSKDFRKRAFEKVNKFCDKHGILQ